MNNDGIKLDNIGDGIRPCRLEPEHEQYWSRMEYCPNCGKCGPGQIPVSFTGQCVPARGMLSVLPLATSFIRP